VKWTTGLRRAVGPYFVCNSDGVRSHWFSSKLSSTESRNIWNSREDQCTISAYFDVLWSTVFNFGIHRRHQPYPLADRIWHTIRYWQAHFTPSSTSIRCIYNLPYSTLFTATRCIQTINQTTDSALDSSYLNQINRSLVSTHLAQRGFWHGVCSVHRNERLSWCCLQLIKENFVWVMGS
jgi:hypothetical protein